MKKHLVTIWPDGKVLEVDESTRLMTALIEAGYTIHSSCGGKAVCTDCRVLIRTGDMNVVPPEYKELALLGNVFHLTRERLSCQTYIKGPVTVDLTTQDPVLFESKRQAATTKRPTQKVHLRRTGDRPRDGKTEQESTSVTPEGRPGGMRRPKKRR